MDQQEAREILRKYADVFAKKDLDSGQTSVVKHKLTLKEGAMPIKECYKRVPPWLYNEMQRHLQEMIDVRAIRPSHSPWASSIVLVRKKNGILHFCINLRKVNSLMVKDAYNISRIQDKLDSLQGAV